MGLEKYIFYLRMKIKLKTILKFEESLIFLHCALVGISKANISDCHTGMYCCFVVVWYVVQYCYDIVFCITVLGLKNGSSTRLEWLWKQAGWLFSHIKEK